MWQSRMTNNLIEGHEGMFEAKEEGLVFSTTKK